MEPQTLSKLESIDANPVLFKSKRKWYLALFTHEPIRFGDSYIEDSVDRMVIGNTPEEAIDAFIKKYPFLIKK